MLLFIWDHAIERKNGKQHYPSDLSSRRNCKNLEWPMIIESLNMKHQENIVKNGRVSGLTSDLVEEYC